MTAFVGMAPLERQVKMKINRDVSSLLIFTRFVDAGKALEIHQYYKPR